MANKLSSYDTLMSEASKKDDISDAFSLVIRNPYRLLGASTFSTYKELQEAYELWQEEGDRFKSPFDKSKLGEPVRTKENMKWALENSDSYVYKIFWFSDPNVAAKLGNKAEFIEFFGKKQTVNTTDYNTFLAQYMFLCVYDRNFTMREQWGIVLNLINDLLNVSVGRFWGFFSGNKIEAIDNNKMAFLYNEFKDNILFPIKEIAITSKERLDLEKIIHIHGVISLVEEPQLPFAKIDTALFEAMEKWFVKEAEYVNNVLLANVTGISASSMEEKLAITNAYNYIISYILPEFKKVVNNVIPQEHSMNTRMRMMFSGKFIVVSKILCNAGLYNESLRLCQIFNELFEDDYITNEIENLNKLIKQDENTRMAPNARGTAMGNLANEETSGLAMPTELGELEKIENERKKEFFKKKKNPKSGIDYKEVIQGVINNELKLVHSEEEQKMEKVPYIDREAEKRAAAAKADAEKLQNAITELQRIHAMEMNEKMNQLNQEYKQSMRRMLGAIIVILLVLAVGVAIFLAGVMGNGQHNILSVGNSAKSGENTADISEQAEDMTEEEKQLQKEKNELVVYENRLSELRNIKADIEVRYNETGDSQWAEQLVEKQNEYDSLYAEYTAKVEEFNQHKKNIEDSIE